MFDNDTFNRQYETSALAFETATSTHFVCNYSYRDKDTVYQFSPKIIPTRSDFVAKIKNLLPNIVGDERANKCTVELIVDERIDNGESVCLVIPGFTNKTLSSSKQLSTKLLTDLHNALS